MNCNFCGARIDKAEHSCSYCGQKNITYFNNNRFSHEKNNLNKKYYNENTASLKDIFKVFTGIILLFGIIIAIFIAIAYIQSYTRKNSDTNNNNNSTTLLTRNANNNDIYVNTNYDFSISVNITITPNVDINNLKLTILFYDNNQKTITTKTKTLGNVTKNKEIAEFFNVSDKAAGIRAERIKELLKRGKWFTSKLEKEYYKIYLKNKV